MASNQDPSAADGKDGKDTAGHRKFTDADGGDLAPIGGTTPRQPKVSADDDDVEAHLYGAGPSTQGEAFPHPGDNPHGDRRR